MRYLPDVQYLFPGAGISVFNVWDVPYVWWSIYVNRVNQYELAQQKQAQEQRKRGTRRG